MSQHYRALFISDVHLGTRWTQAAQLLEFLAQARADTLYLVGDIVDFWRIRRGFFWTDQHGNVLKEILRIANAGTRVVFIPGNHDEGLRAYCGQHFGNIEIVRSTVHTTAAGRRYLVTHGDEYDVVVRRARWLALLGDRGYAFMLAFNRPFNWVRGLLGKDHWSIAAYMKTRVKSCVGRAGNFEGALIAAAGLHQAAGVICGHIHRAASRTVDGVHYVNTGDWVESCTAVVETRTGVLQLIDWTTGAVVATGLGEPPPQAGAAA